MGSFSSSPLLPVKRIRRIFVLLGGAILLSLLFAFIYQIWVYYKEIKYQTEHPEEAFATFFTSSSQGTATGDFISPTADDDPSFGPEDAPIQIIAFEDFDCPFSTQFFYTVKQVAADYPETVRFVYRDYANTEIHPTAQLAAEAAECAQDQEKFWPMHDKLFLNPQAHAREDLLRYAQELNLDVSAFNQCLSNQTHRTEVEGDLADALKSGISGTPTMFMNGKKIQGAIPYRFLKLILKKELEIERR